MPHRSGRSRDPRSQLVGAECFIKVEDTPKIFKIVVRSLAHEPLANHGEYNPSEVLGATDAPVTEHDRGHQPVLLDGEVTQTQAKLRAGDVTVGIRQVLGSAVNPLRGEGETLAYEGERLDRIRTSGIRIFFQFNSLVVVLME